MDGWIDTPGAEEHRKFIQHYKTLWRKEHRVIHIGTLQNACSMLHASFLHAISDQEFHYVTMCQCPSGATTINSKFARSLCLPLASTLWPCMQLGQDIVLSDCALLPDPARCSLTLRLLLDPAPAHCYLPLPLHLRAATCDCACSCTCAWRMQCNGMTLNTSKLDGTI